MHATPPTPPHVERGTISLTKSLSQSPKSLGKRAAIIRAATEIINSKSYALATMTEIAASLGLRDATLYYYYPNKRALVYACHVRSLERFEQLVVESETAGGTGAARLRRLITTMLTDSYTNGAQLYFGDHSYLDAVQREAIDSWAARLSSAIENWVVAGMADGSLVACEPQLVVQLVLGMLIWLAKWTPAIPDLTPDRLMSAFDAVAFTGLERTFRPS